MPPKAIAAPPAKGQKLLFSFFNKANPVATAPDSESTFAVVSTKSGVVSSSPQTKKLSNNINGNVRYLNF